MDINKKTYQDIEKAKKIINLHFYQEIDCFSKYSSLYAFTNKNINTAYNYLNVKNKKILTVAASGDHIFEAYLKGAKDVVAFDINCLTKYYIELKYAAIKVLPKESFVDFFVQEPIFSKKLNNLDFTTYKLLRPHLQEDCQLFWDSLYKVYSGNEIRKSKLFYSIEESLEFLNFGLSYLKPQNYKKLKKIFQNNNIFAQNKLINFNIKEIPKNITDKFDIIYLSNIPDYIDEIFSKPYIDNFQSFIKKDLDSLLNERGIIMASYMFHGDYNSFKTCPLINSKTAIKKFSQKNFEYQIIDNSSMKNCTNDKILIYKK